MSHWISVRKAIPPNGRKVLATYLNSYKNRRIITAQYFRRFEVESSGENGEFDEYRKEDDTYYVCEGWYECVDNWNEYSSFYVTEGTVTHWMELPEFDVDE